MVRHAKPIAKAMLIALATAGLLSAGLADRAPAAGAPQGQRAAFAQTRTISFYHIHTQETLTVTYKKDGAFVPDALEKINWIMRDWRKNQAIKMDPNTVDIIWEMHEELGSKEPVHIICGYRSRDTNDMLRRTRGGQASQSQHMTGKAMDIAFPDVPLRRMRYSAMIRERGGVGYYPTSGIPFVHVDTSRVRHWPRMVRDELALIFPAGRSQHEPADGRPLTPADAAAARTRNPALATEVAQFFDIRNSYGQRPAVMVAEAAEAAAPRPVLKKEARPAERPVALAALAPPAPAPAAKKPLAAEERMAVGAPPADQEALVWNASVRPGSDDEEATNKPQPITAALVSPPKPAERPADRSSRFSKAEHAANRAALDKLVLAALSTDAPAAAKPEKSAPPKAPAKAEPAKPAPLDGAAVMNAGIGARHAWVQAPLFDDDHPEDSAYNPFPVAPMMTETSSVDDPALTGLVHPNAGKALDLIAEEGAGQDIALGTAKSETLATAQAFAKPTEAKTTTQASLVIAQRTVVTQKR